ncbi:MAG: tRNA pseudouridine(55) synthase TruB [Saprospiraceae bacterium]
MIISKGSTFDGNILEGGGVFLIDKPLTWTSFDVVNKLRNLIRKSFNVKKVKVGHAGTLDPLASGLLIVCMGKKTKDIESYQGLPKIYTGTMTFGATTPTYDSESEITEISDYQPIALEALEKVMQDFLGEQLQVPPIYSAVKIGGTSSYHLARRGVEVTLSPRKVTIYRFECLHWDDPILNFLVECSKGTYIRSLAHDLGKQMKSGAYLSSLRREQIGEYDVKYAWTMDELIYHFTNM